MSQKEESCCYCGIDIWLSKCYEKDCNVKVCFNFTSIADEGECDCPYENISRCMANDCERHMCESHRWFCWHCRNGFCKECEPGGFDCSPNLVWDEYLCLNGPTGWICGPCMDKDAQQYETESERNERRNKESTENKWKVTK
jgi:hypothetical protein